MTRGRQQGQLTPQQIQGGKSLRDTIKIDELTKDELKLILFFLYRWELTTDTVNHARLVPNPNIKEDTPPCKYHTANFARLRYKLENAVYPKNID